MHYSVTVPLDLGKWQIDRLNRRLDYIRMIYNQAAIYISNHYNNFLTTKEFKQTRSEKSIIAYFAKNKLFNKKLNISYSLTKYGIRNLVFAILKLDMGNGKTYRQNGITAHSMEYVSTSLYESLISSAKQKKPIILRKQKDNFHFNTLTINKSKDRFDGLNIDFEKHIVLLNINGRQRKQAQFLSLNMNISKKCGRFVLDNMPRALDNVFRISIKRRFIRNKTAYYVVFGVKGTPYYSNLEIGKGCVGIDLGPSTVAVSSPNNVFLEQLSNNISNLEKRVKMLSSKMNRSRRFNNPDKYNADGSYKKGVKDFGWIKSKRYLLLQTKHQNIIRKIVSYRNLYQQQLIRKIIPLGNTFIVERNDFWKWKKKSKVNKINPNNGRIRSKKSRLGRSIKKNSPRMFLDKLSNKIQYLDGKIILVSPKNAATQYDFTNDTFVKRELKEKIVILGDNTIHHRDLIAAFNLQHLNLDSSNTKEYNIQEMKKDYDVFSEKEKIFLSTQ